MKFTEDGGWVRCRWQVADGQPARGQRQRGRHPGGRAADLFTRFFRSSTAQSNAIQGSGLGLTIVDSIVQGHGGDITVVSRHMGGSTFTVSLPMLSALDGLPSAG